MKVLKATGLVTSDRHKDPITGIMMVGLIDEARNEHSIIRVYSPPMDKKLCVLFPITDAIDTSGDKYPSQLLAMYNHNISF